MGTLGQYLHDARVAKDIDLRDAAQQTRISIQYLSALEREDFTKLPGEVFVRGFLKNYSRFLNLDESEVMKRYAEIRTPLTLAPSPAAPAPVVEHPVAPDERKVRKETSLEPFIWGSVIIVLLLVFLFTSLPGRSPKKNPQPDGPSAPAVMTMETGSSPAVKPDKLYLEVVANEDSWVLVRTDDSPQKKAVLKRGESLIWSADERFLLSYARVGALKLLLNGEELTVNGTKETVVRDLAVTRAGIMNQPAPVRQARQAKPKPAAQPKQAQQAQEAQQEQKVQPQIEEQQALPPQLSVSSGSSTPSAPAPSPPAAPPAQ
jgi:cytoskeletal protein RodZ